MLLLAGQVIGLGPNSFKVREQDSEEQEKPHAGLTQGQDTF